MLSLISSLLLKMIGIKLIGSHHPEIKKKVYAVGPHTSNWDFPLGILVKWKLKVKVILLGKKSLFKPLYGWLFRMLGVVPVDRTQSSNTVHNIANIFKERNEMNIALSPEGTRKKVDKLKKGFYYIAKAAEVPIIFIKFDFEHKEIIFGEPFFATDDEEKDWDYINSYFDGINGKIPEYSFGYGK